MVTRNQRTVPSDPSPGVQPIHPPALFQLYRDSDSTILWYLSALGNLSQWAQRSCPCLVRFLLNMTVHRFLPQPSWSSPGGGGRTCLILPSAVALGVGDGRTKSQGYRTSCGRPGYPEKGQMRCIFTRVFLGPRSHLCVLPVTFARLFHPELRKKPHAYRGTACLCCHSSLIVVSLHICVSRIYRHFGPWPKFSVSHVSVVGRKQLGPSSVVFLPFHRCFEILWGFFLNSSFFFNNLAFLYLLNSYSNRMSVPLKFSQY